MKARMFLVFFFIFVLLLQSTMAFAVVLFPDFKMTINNGSAEATIEGAELNLQAENTTDFSTSGTQIKPMWEYNWNLTVDPDPVIGGTFNITNLTGSTRTFSILFDLPTTISFAPGIQEGFIEALLEDTSGTSGFGVDGADSDNMVWNGRIDGTNTLRLPPTSPDVFSLSCSGPGCSDPLSRETGGPELYGPGVQTDIGIEFVFDLSVGDKLSFTTEFEVQPVPVPAALPLFATGLVGLWGLARKSKETSTLR